MYVCECTRTVRGEREEEEGESCGEFVSEDTVRCLGSVEQVGRWRGKGTTNEVEGWLCGSGDCWWLEFKGLRRGGGH